MRKGFTLVELLAVMVVLAVLALIAAPTVLSIIDSVKLSATLRSAEMYLNAVENSIMKENMLTAGKFKPNTCTVIEGDINCDGTLVEVEISGEAPDDGSIIVFNNGKVERVEFLYQENIVINDEKGALFLKEE